MKPYYQKDGQTIYLGDCREILPSLESDSIDLVLTDPPYPSLKGGTKISRDGLGKQHRPSISVGTPWGEDISAITEAYRIARLGMIVFCSFHSVCSIPKILGSDGVALVAWCQPNAALPVQVVPHYQTEFIWAFKKAAGLDWRKLKTYYVISRLQTGLCATERIVDGDGRAVHPAQKPLALIARLLLIGGTSVLDPYCGTGTTLRAAKDSGMTGIGIEIEERYCELAAKRLDQQVLPFAAPEPQITATQGVFDGF